MSLTRQRTRGKEKEKERGSTAISQKSISIFYKLVRRCAFNAFAMSWLFINRMCSHLSLLKLIFMTKWQTDEWEVGKRKRIWERERIGVRECSREWEGAKQRQIVASALVKCDKKLNIFQQNWCDKEWECLACAFFILSEIYNYDLFAIFSIYVQTRAELNNKLIEWSFNKQTL